MSRSGYIEDDGDDPLAMGRWRGAVKSAIRGKRGQKLLREMRDALDAMPEKRLIAEELIDESGDVCALGSVGIKRQIPDLIKLDPDEPEQVAKVFDVNEKLVREIAWENDEGHRTPEERWQYMRKWVERNIVT